MFALHAPLILASQSPRRRRLLTQLGLQFEVIPSAIDEHLPPNLSHGDATAHVALDKAAAVAADHPDALTLGADTVVVLDDDVLGKPADAAQARRMLLRLSGRTHEVFTGFALVHPSTGRHVQAHERTAVSFADLSDEEIDAYVETGSPLDKAGAYGIQDDLGALFVARIDGDYNNVVGLPLHRLYRVLRQHFADLVDASGVTPR